MAAIFVRWAGEMPSAVLGFYRMLVGLFFVGPLAIKHRKLGCGGRSWLWAALGGASFSLDLFFWHQAVHWTSAANATLLVGLAPLWVAIFSVIFLRFMMPALGWLGLTLALGGAISLGLGAGATLGGGRGEWLAILASFGYAGYTLCLSKARQTLEAPVALVVAIFFACLSFGLMALLGGNAFTGFSAKAWLAVLGLGLVVQALAWWLISWGLGHVSVASGALGLLGQQVATVFLGWAFLGEMPVPVQWLGIVLILFGIALASKFPSQIKSAD